MENDEAADPVYHDALSVSRVSIVGNSIQSAAFGGIRLGADSGSNAVNNVIIQRNVLQNVNSTSVANVYPGTDLTTLSCAGNTVDGVVWATQCDKSVAPIKEVPTATGSSLQCKADGTLE
jgi:hypothetical protein